MVRIEVVYATRDEQELLAVEVPTGTTIRDAIERSGIQRRFPGIVLARGRVGVFGREVGLDAMVRAGDRVEIYRPLIVDPKEARKRRDKRRR